MSLRLNRVQRRALQRESKSWPDMLTLIPPHMWPSGLSNPDRIRVWRSRDFLVQEFLAVPPAIVRLSVNRTSVRGERWADGITWEELQDLKAQCGYADSTAVEVFPPARDIVNMANMRHLWVLGGPLPFAWREAK